MYRQYTQPNRRGIVGAIVLIILILLAIYGLIQGVFAMIGVGYKPDCQSRSHCHRRH